MKRGNQPQVSLVIVNEKTNALFSTLKVNTPKMYNAMKDLCTKYAEDFKETFKVRRCLRGRDGKLKFV